MEYKNSPQYCSFHFCVRAKRQQVFFLSFYRDITMLRLYLFHSISVSAPYHLRIISVPSPSL